MFLNFYHRVAATQVLTFSAISNPQFADGEVVPYPTRHPPLEEPPVLLS
jgi:hypothetical protein